MQAKSRRALLKDLGLLACSPLWAGALGSLLPTEKLMAQASGSGAPLKLLLLSFPHGLVNGAWEPTRLGDGTLTFQNSPVLAPLERFKDKINILSGLGFENLKPTSILRPQFSHGGLASAFTGAARGDEQGAAASLDYLLSLKLFGADRVLRLGSFLAYNAPQGLDDAQSNICFSGSGDSNKLSVLGNPRKAYEKAFADFVPQGGSADADRRKQEQLALHAALSRQLSQMEKRLAGDELALIRMHQETLTGMMQNTSSFTCQSRPELMVDGFQAREEDAGRLTQRQMDLAVAALQCGGTRIATLELLAHSHGSYNMAKIIANDPLSRGQSPSPLLDTTNFHAQIAHNVSIGGRFEGSATPAIQEAFLQSQRWFFTQFAYLLERLQSAGILDSTLVMVGTEMGSPQHLGDSAPFLIAGGGFGMGRWFEYETTRVSDYEHRCTPHQGLLVSVAQRFGLNVNTFGDERFMGPLGRDKRGQVLSPV